MGSNIPTLGGLASSDMTVGGVFAATRTTATTSSWKTDSQIMNKRNWWNKEPADQSDINQSSLNIKPNINPST